MDSLQSKIASATLGTLRSLNKLTSLRKIVYIESIPSEHTYKDIVVSMRSIDSHDTIWKHSYQRTEDMNLVLEGIKKKFESRGIRITDSEAEFKEYHETLDLIELWTKTQMRYMSKTHPHVKTVTIKSTRSFKYSAEPDYCTLTLTVSHDLLHINNLPFKYEEAWMESMRQTLWQDEIVSI